MGFRADHIAYRFELRTLVKDLVPFVPVSESDNDRRRLISAYYWRLVMTFGKLQVGHGRVETPMGSRNVALV